MLAVATQAGAAPTDIALAWMLPHGGEIDTSNLGSRTREQLDAGLGALDVKLSSESNRAPRDVSSVLMGTPHEQIEGSAATMAGGKPELLRGE